MYRKRLLQLVGLCLVLSQLVVHAGVDGPGRPGQAGAVGQYEVTICAHVVDRYGDPAIHGGSIELSEVNELGWPVRQIEIQSLEHQADATFHHLLDNGRYVVILDDYDMVGYTCASPEHCWFYFTVEDEPVVWELTWTVLEVAVSEIYLPVVWCNLEGTLHPDLIPETWQIPTHLAESIALELQYQWYGGDVPPMERPFRDYARLHDLGLPTSDIGTVTVSMEEITRVLHYELFGDVVLVHDVEDPWRIAAMTPYGDPSQQ